MSYGEVLVDKRAIELIERVLDYTVIISIVRVLYGVCFHLYSAILNCSVMCGHVYVWFL